MLNWAQQFNIFCFLDNQGYSIEPNQYECLLAAGAADVINGANANFEAINDFTKEKWAFGHLSYNLGERWYNIPTATTDAAGFSSFLFFQPLFLLRIQANLLYIDHPDADTVFNAIQAQVINTTKTTSIEFESHYSKEEYVEIIKKLQQHIQLGDCYELNFCQEFFAKNAVIDPVAVFHKLMEVSPNPFSAFYKVENSYLLCASPERYLRKAAEELTSQPIKGTHRRVLNDTALDLAAKQALENSTKDRSENVMVVDLVRNDLSKVCKTGSVRVKELFKVYAFPQVFQMISTIKGEVEAGVSFTQMIEASFPMGSMTGAPKKKVMELLDHYEKGDRGIFSGAVGYMDPEGNFDLNVIIRSLMYNAESALLSYQVGSGITIYSNPELEWEECLLKAAAIKKVLT